ncbi:MAG TPA: acetyl-CoA carboxylase biotin carboxylase subunit [Anseongella sp.]
MKKLLIANRGEIALRIMRSAKEMGINTVAVYSEADRRSPHVQFADEAICIGPPPANDSYLSVEKILEACRKTGADAVHPGYGFLSENAAFARALEQAGVIFVGPPPAAIEMMGNKLEAKETARSQGVPLVPGTKSAIRDTAEALEIAREIGFPLLVKAAAGGGGKGMRIIESINEVEEQIMLAISEATSSFGDGSVFIEKYVTAPRHIEIQVLADSHGNVLHLFERECSVQRRHQKVIEEAPSSVLTPAIREEMGRSAVALCKACGYVGAGTVEFIFDENHHYYFLEMNTRLQVEHPVTELITGIDLVKEQLKIARGEALSFKQEDLRIEGHSIELRVYAEDPSTGFLPDIGTIQHYRLPQGPGIRVDDGYENGMEIPIYYDPMIAKLVVHGSSRKEAISRMIRAIGEYRIAGVQTTLAFGDFVMRHPAFVSGRFDTHFVKDHFQPESGASTELNDIGESIVSSIISYNLINSLLKNKKCQNVRPLTNSAWVRNRRNS